MNSNLMLLPIIKYRRILWRFVPAFVCLLALIIAWRWQKQQINLISAWKGKARNCATLAESMLRLRDQPRLVEDRVMDSHTLAGYLENAARRAQMSRNQISSIRPQYPRRLGKTPYVQTKTRIRFTEMKLEEMAKLIWYLQQQSPGLITTDLRIWTDSPDSSTWEVEMTIVALAYSSLAAE